jgi:hypothetical protein
MMVGLAMLLVGCAAMQDKVVVATSTILGFELAQNPATGMYQGRFGYARAEIALVPTNGVDVLTEIQFNNLMRGGGLYQRMAVGSNAVRSSMFMFAKSANGVLDPMSAEAISRSISGIPATSPTGTSAKLPLSAAYRTAIDRSKFDTTAQSLGYLNYEAFLLNTTLSTEQVAAMSAALKNAGALP